MLFNLTRPLPRLAMGLAISTFAATAATAQARLSLPAGTVIIVQTQSALRSNSAQVGQTFETTVKDAIGLDPSHETDGLSLNITSEVFENLVKFKPGTFEVLPSLASSWTSSDAGKTWTFVLRSGVKFSDGTPLVAHRRDRPNSLSRHPRP